VFKQPLILAYILAGVLLGPLVFNIITLPDLLNSLSAIGVAFLLFLIGLQLDVRRMREIGKPSLILGIGQILFTAAISFLLLLFFHIDPVPALYGAIALTFSSTIIVVKLLSEKAALNSLFGRLSIGMLLVQDFVAMLILIVLAGIGDPEAGTAVVGSGIVFTLAKGALLFLFTAIMSRYILPPIFAYLARNDELLFLAAVSWSFLYAIFAAAIGFSIEIGAFLAGIALASVPYNLEIAGRVKNLRDFFITIFFVALGTQLTLSAISAHLGLLIVLSLFVLIGNPLIVMMLMGMLGYHRRTGFFTGVTVAQISEFSLILIAIGVRLGHVSQELASVITAIGIITIALSAYLVSNMERLYTALNPFLKVFQRGKIQEEVSLSELPAGHVILVGVRRTGRKVLDSLTKLGAKVICIDFDPQVVKALQKEGVTVVYGDLSDVDLLERVNVSEARMIITTVPDTTDTLRLLQNLKRKGLNVPTYLMAFSPTDAVELYENGASYVIIPQELTGAHMGVLLEEVLMRNGSASTQRAEHLAELRERYGFMMRS
jgi:Kef-type K+ transport system membrane component KefB/voltage-gated potassium channel Kch